MGHLSFWVKRTWCESAFLKHLPYGHRKLARGIRAAVRPVHERLAHHEHLLRVALNQHNLRNGKADNE